ncbi:cytochrome c biogenesis CcdA family protein [Roseburia sp. 831b]|uniref:cytochrome c biogenesis CcdA family protein n=1 Tax=Roseburia sp. 831b TaxID=1261635 RepID=UPI000952B7B3|nr:cytochrome c biogenesis protein CcdA [Roseburia sp. 831b]WVK72457.1 cytochrome c biogenesis protein CcdA [Roseburia sp. 831b]
MVDTWLNQIAQSIQSNMWIAPLLALLAGVLTSFTPCALSNIPLIIGYVGGVGEKNTKKAFRYSVIFALGTAVTFITLGLIATSAGKLMGNSSQIWYLVLGVLMVLMALQTWEIFQIIPSINLLSKSKAKGIIGAFIAGVLGGVFSSPCSTPVLIALLAIVAGKGNLIWGILLMFLYSIGHSALVIVAGTSISFVKKISSNEKYNKVGIALKIVMGTTILLIGLYMFWLAF